MAGHSKFANIKHRKAAQDKKRGKIFARLAKEISVAAKQGSPDPESNPRLRTAIMAAQNANMPKDNIQRAIDKVHGEDGAGSLEEIRYEGYGPGGVAVMVETVTDNKNRTAGDVRAAFSKFGGSLGETNSVAFMFDHIGEIVYPPDAADAEAIFEAAVEAGAEDVESTEESHVIRCVADDFNDVATALEGRFGRPERAGLTWRPQTTTEVSDKHAESLFKMLDALDDLDDVQAITSNFEASDEIFERYAG